MFTPTSDKKQKPLIINGFPKNSVIPLEFLESSLDCRSFPHSVANSSHFIDTSSRSFPRFFPPKCHVFQHILNGLPPNCHRNCHVFYEMKTQRSSILYLIDGLRAPFVLTRSKTLNLIKLFLYFSHCNRPNRFGMCGCQQMAKVIIGINP